FILFSYSFHYRYLHSFPTRRSSDLEYRPSIFFSVPTLYAAILREAETTGQPLDFSPVRQCVSAGETLPAEIFERWKRTTGLEILDRKSTRLNSSHVAISYAVFCLKK